MIELTHSVSPICSRHFPTLGQWRALRLLSEAWLAACSEGEDVWQLAVEIDELRALDLSNTDLRCLIRWGYLEHAQERTTAGASQRLFQSVHSLMLPKRSCFVITAKGREAASEYGSNENEGAAKAAGEPTAVPCSLAKVPYWDGQARQLRWQGYLIKEFRRPAVNQERVLTALEEEGWPKQIDDPLPPTPGIDPKARLHDTIKSLNRHRLSRFVCFRGDGRGMGIGWMIIQRA